ncbi:hypothetical protein J6590_056117 [Homalodisca vitripennis]|nr:hypothetical protein J6590_056117 [Homalodisca vitripennis]
MSPRPRSHFFVYLKSVHVPLQVFDRVRLEQREALGKVELVDMDLGWESHSSRITPYVNMIIHCALVTDFTHSLRDAVDVNVKQTIALLQLAYSCKKLEAFVVATSTLCHSRERVLEERFYPPPITASAMCVVLDSLAQHPIANESKGLTVAAAHTHRCLRQVSQLFIGT